MGENRAPYEDTQNFPQDAPGPGGRPDQGTMPTGAPVGGYYASPQQPFQPVPAAAPQASVNDTTPLVLGILSIIFSGVAGLVLGIFGISTSNKVLKQVRSTKARAGKITSIIGIVLSSVVLTVVIVSLITGFLFIQSLPELASAFNSALENAPSKVADASMSEVCNLSSENRGKVINQLDQELSASCGYSMSDVGIDTTKLSNFLFDNVSYQQTSVEVDGTSAVVTYSVTSRDYTSLMNEAEAEYREMEKTVIATDELSAYRNMGSCCNSAMDKVSPTTKTVTLRLDMAGDTWVVRTSDKNGALDTIYYGGLVSS
jgi:hypothetical protein